MKKFMADCLLLGYPGEYIDGEEVKKSVKQMGYNISIEYISPYYPRVLNDIAFLKNELEKNNVNTQYILNISRETGRLKYLLSNEQFGFVAIVTRYFRSFSLVKKIIRLIRQYNDKTKIIVGGSSFSSAMSKMNDSEKIRYLEYLGADYYLLGGDIVSAISELNKTSNPEVIANIVYKDGGEYKYTYDKENIITAEDFIDWKPYFSNIKEIAASRTSISCPFSCSFCSVKEKIQPYRLLDEKKIVEEMRMFSETGRVKYINFTDETVNVPKDRFKRLLRMIIDEELQTKWFSFVRSEYIDDETARLMYLSGCCAVLIGLESGSQKQLDNMNKQTTVKALAHGHEFLKKYGILTIGFYIVGFPGENKDSIKMTEEHINSLQPDFIRLNIWECDMNTPIWAKRDEYGLEYSNGFWRHNGMDSREAFNNIHQISQKIDKSINLDKLDYTYGIQLIDKGIDKKTVKDIFKNIKLDKTEDTERIKYI